MTITNHKYSIYEASDILHQVGDLHNEKLHVDYGTGEKFTSSIVHMLSYIVNNPGISVTRLARETGKTKGAISQTVRQLLDKGLLRKEDNPSNDRSIMLYATDEGMNLHNHHKAYDTVDFGRSYKALIEIYGADEVNNAIGILETWVSLRRKTLNAKQD